MHGDRPTINDIILTELPDPVSLLCDEHLEEEEEEQNADYTVYSYCGHCDLKLKIYVRATSEAIKALQQLLLGGLAVLCPSCGRLQQ